jgi:hypothetical protein
MNGVGDEPKNSSFEIVSFTLNIALDFAKIGQNDLPQWPLPLHFRHCIFIS